MVQGGWLDRRMTSDRSLKVVDLLCLLSIFPTRQASALDLSGLLHPCFMAHGKFGSNDEKALCTSAFRMAAARGVKAPKFSVRPVTFQTALATPASPIASPAAAPAVAPCVGQRVFLRADPVDNFNVITTRLLHGELVQRVEHRPGVAGEVAGIGQPGRNRALVHGRSGSRVVHAARRVTDDVEDHATADIGQHRHQEGGVALHERIELPDEPSGRSPGRGSLSPLSRGPADRLRGRGQRPSGSDVSTAAVKCASFRPSFAYAPSDPDRPELAQEDTSRRPLRFLARTGVRALAH